MTFKEAEEKIKKYYESIKVIERLAHRLDIYLSRKSELEAKIENSEITLTDDFKAVNFDKIGGSQNMNVSPQEKAIDRAFHMLEKNLEETKAEIILIEEQISAVKAENSEIEYILNGLKPEYKGIMESLYLYKKGALKTSMNCNMDKVTVYRKRNKVIKDVVKWLNFYN